MNEAYEVLGDRVLREVAETYGGTEMAEDDVALRAWTDSEILGVGFVDRVRSELSRKRWGLPTWGWGLIGLGLAGAWWLRRGSGSSYGRFGYY